MFIALIKHKRRGTEERGLKGETSASITGGTRKHNGRLDAATTLPAEASGVRGDMPNVRKEEGSLFTAGKLAYLRA